MNRRILVYLSLIALAGCKISDSLRPGAVQSPRSGFAISDGAHSSIAKPGNPDFFFLPPLVPDPKKNPNYTKGAFNGKLNPVVDICEVNATTEAQVNAGAPCKSGGYFASFQLTSKNVVSGDDQGGDNKGKDDARSDPVLGGSSGITTGATIQDNNDNDGHGSNEPHYQLKWKVPSSKIKFFRISVRVGAKGLGAADVEKGGDGNDDNKIKDVNTGDFVHLDDNSLQINFRIEQFALCDPPGTGPCTSQVVDLGTGGTVSTTLTGGTAPSGVIIPPQSNTSQTPVITVQGCPDLNNRATDLPTFGKCVRITSDPPLPPAGLTTAATVFICDISVPAGGGIASPAQEKRITLHRLDVVGSSQTVTALPHIAGCPVNTASAASVTGLFQALARGQWKSAGSQALGLLGPKPLYATMRLDQGGGGRSDDFSDFQFALPAKLAKVAGDNQTAQPGTSLPINPKVLVTDLGGEPVKGARITFTPTNGSVSPATPVVTGADGTAQVAWTIKSTAGPNSLTASGRGVAGADFNGPRTGIDPFQPIQSPFCTGPENCDPVVTNPLNVTVLTGSQTFAATGGFLPVDIIGFGSAGWLYHIFQVPPGGDGPTGWQTTTDFGGSLGKAGFGSGPFDGCTGVPASVTTWSAGTDLVHSDILLRKGFTTPYAGTLTISLLIDNDAKVYLDGNDITGTGQATDQSSHFGTNGFWIHDNCANGSGPPSWTVSNVGAGNHTIAIHGSDRGGAAFVDVKVSLAPPAPSGGN
jgi:hypothetical protein